RRTRRASSSSSATSSPSSRASRCPRRRNGSGSCSRRSGTRAWRPHPPPPEAEPRAMRLIDLLGVDEVPDGTMQMAWVDGSDPVLVVNVDGEIRAMQGICSHEYFELD